MRIAVCDDDLRELREIMSLIEEYPRKAAYGISATAFSNSEELAERIGEFDVFLLDYRMPDIDGFELAKRIREEYMTTKTIIFISQYDDIVYDAFEVHAHRYLTKPVEKEKLYRALNELDKDAYIHYDSGGEEKVFVCKRSLDSLEKELTPFHFFRTHRSYLTNLSMIDYLNTDGIYIKNREESIPIRAKSLNKISRKLRELARQRNAL